MQTRALPAAALVAFMAACGARSSLRSSSEGATGAGGSGTGTTGAGGAGPSTASATTSVGSSTGGSSNVVCPALTIKEMVELPALDDLRAAHDPLLQGLEKGDVLALVRRQSPQATGGLSSVSQVRLAPWKTWPPVFESPLLVFSNSWNVPFVSSVEPLGTYALGLEPFPTNNPTGCELAAFHGLSPDAPPGPNALTLKLNGTCDDAPVAIATAGNGTHFVANDVQFLGDGQPVRSLVAHVLDASGNVIASMNPVCTSTSFVGDVLADETGFLFVHSSADSPWCAEKPQNAPGRRLLLRRLQGSGEVKTSVVHEGMDDHVYARILPRNGGAWALYRESGASALIQPSGMAQRLVGSNVSGEAFPVTPPGTGRMASAAFGDGFVVAFVDAIDPSSPTVVVRVYDAAGTLAAESAFGTLDAWLQGGRLALVASPDAKSFLVGWIGAKASPGAETFLRRFDCIDHE